MLSQSKRMSVFDMVREAMDFRYPLSSPPLTRLSAQAERIQASFTSPIQNRAVLETQSAQVLHKTPNRLDRNTQTWLGHNILLPTSSSPIQTPSERSMVSADLNQVEVPATQTSKATGNSPNFYNTLQLSDCNLDLNPSLDESISPKNRSIDPASIEESSDEECEGVNISGLTELTESSLDPVDCNRFAPVSARPSTTIPSKEHWLSQPSRLKRDKHPGDLFLGNPSTRSPSRDFAYEMDMTSLANQRQHSPTESELASKNFEFHNAIPEEEQVQRFQNHAFRRALCDVASGLSLKKQYYAWDQVRLMLDSEKAVEENAIQETNTNISNDQALYQADIISGSERLKSTRAGKAKEVDQHVLRRDHDNQLQYYHRLRDDMKVDEPQSAAMEISPIEESNIDVRKSTSVHIPSLASIKRSEFFASGALIHNNDQYQHALLLDDNHPFGQQRHYVTRLRNDNLQKGFFDHQSQRSESESEVEDLDVSSTSRANTPRLLPKKTFEIREDSSVLKSAILTSPKQKRTSSIVSISSDDSFDHQLRRYNKIPMTRIIDASTIRQSVERETSPKRCIREFTPAYEDRSASPSPVSHMSARITSDAESDNDVDMLDVPHMSFEREDSMPPPSTYSPTRFTHNIQREYNLPSSSPTSVYTPTRVAYQEVTQQSPIPLLLRSQPNSQPHLLPQQYSSHKQSESFLIPAPPPIPINNHPLELCKRSTRRKSTVQGGKTSKIEKPRSTTIGTIEQQQNQRGRALSRKVTQAQAKARINRVITQAGGGSLNLVECDLLDKELNAGCNDASKLTMRRSKRLMEKV